MSKQKDAPRRGKPARKEPKPILARVVPTRGLSGLLNGYSVFVNGEDEIAAGLGLHAALDIAREHNGVMTE